MTNSVAVSFSKPESVKKNTLVILSDSGGKISKVAKAQAGTGLARAIQVSEFKGKVAAVLEMIAPAGTELDRVLVLGVGDAAALGAQEWTKLGGALAGKLSAGTQASVALELDGVEISAENAANFAFGAALRGYGFDKYKTKKADGEATKGAKLTKLTLQCADAAAAKKAFSGKQGIADGVSLARDLVNEPANILGTVEFTAAAKSLEKLGVDVEILGEKEMKKLGMGALLGVAQGSVRPPRLVIMRWNGGKLKDKPIAFVGKGVVFDSGGVSIKPAAGMEDMKGDMGGAAAVTGLMHALASRKAKANVIGMIGLVENMVDGNAQRPGDIVTSMSGQTIEVLNTDAEGRLVLADALHYCNTRFKPAFMINLATLTGAIHGCAGAGICRAVLQQ